MTPRIQLPIVAFIIVALSWPTVVFAQDVAASEALFEKALADMEAGKLDEACPAFAESYRLDPRAGTLFTLAECLAQAGKLASAASRYQDYLNLVSTFSGEQLARQGDRLAQAEQARARLEPDIPRLTLKLAPSAPAGVVVERNGTVLAGPSLGVALPLDPGEYVVTTRAPGGDVTTVTIKIEKGEQLEVTLEVAVAGKPADLPDPAPAPTPPAPVETLPVAPSQDTGEAQRIAAYVVGGAGIAGLVIGAITGGLTVASKSTISDNCDLDARTCRNADGLDAVESAHTTGLVSTVSFVIGGVALAAGIVVYLTAPGPSAEPSVALRAGPSGAALSVSF